MKTKLLLIILSVLLFSCNGIENRDPIISTLIKSETIHIVRYNEIQKISKDSNVIKHIDSVKNVLKLEAVESLGLIKSKSGIIFGDLKESQKLLNEYIKLCE